MQPSVVVGVVGMGHVPGIEKYWKEKSVDISELMKYVIKFFVPQIILSRMLKQAGNYSRFHKIHHSDSSIVLS